MANKFEKKYYEHNPFWDYGALEDELNLSRIYRTIDLVPDDVKDIIDVGCGNGVFGNNLKIIKPDIDILSIDRSDAALVHVKTDKAICDIVNLSSIGKAFDCVTCLEVIEHLSLPDYLIALNELASISKKYIIISVPYNENLFKSFTTCPICHTSFSSEMHLRSFSDKDIDSLFIKYGYRCIYRENFFKYKTYLGKEKLLELYDKIIKTDKKFKSPICPICGFENDHQADLFKKPPAQNGKGEKKRLNLKIWLKLFKKNWPKINRDGYWIIALYEKVQNKNKYNKTK
jgi:Methyltransferase domain